MFTRALLLIFGLIHVANALAMLAFPQSWAASVVHRIGPSHLELHFIADIGAAFLVSGAALIWSARRGPRFAVWAVAGAAWPALHALIHAREWLTEGLPRTTGDLFAEGVGVLLVGLAGVALAWARQRQDSPA